MRSDFHVGFLSVAVENELEKSEAALIVPRFVTIVAN